MSIAFLLAFGAAHATHAQQQQPADQNPSQDQNQGQGEAPIPAYRSPLASGADTGEENENASPQQDYTPDTNALTGAQNTSVGTPEGARSYWQPHVDFSFTGDSNASYSSGTSWGEWASVYGALDLHHVSGRSTQTLDYSVGGILSNQAGAENSVVQGLNFSDKMVFRRETISILDQFSYLPETAYGFGGVGGMGFGGVALPGIGGLGISPGLTPDQTILTPQGGNIISNSVILEGDTYLSARSSITMLGGYSLLHFSNSDLLDFRDVNARLGYNYQATRKNTLGFSYTYSGISYTNFDQTIDTHLAQVSYGRKVTGRLAFQISGGPEYAIFSTAIQPSVGAAPSTAQLYWSLSTSLQYQLHRGGLGASYFHGVAGGSGVLPGAISDTVSATASRQLTRTVGSRFNFGYSRNTAVNTALLNYGGYNNYGSFNYWFGGASLNRPFGRNLNVFLSYQLQYQEAGSTYGCVGASCSTNFVVHLISLGVDWHTRPRPF